MRLKVYRKGLWPQRNHGDNAKGKKPQQTDRRRGKPRGSTQALSQIPNTHTRTYAYTHTDGRRPEEGLAADRGNTLVHAGQPLRLLENCPVGKGSQ